MLKSVEEFAKSISCSPKEAAISAMKEGLAVWHYKGVCERVEVTSLEYIEGIDFGGSLGSWLYIAIPDKDTTGKIVFGHVWGTGSPCLYRDTGHYEGTVKELNIRSVSKVETFDHLSWVNPVLADIKKTAEYYGSRYGGGMDDLMFISDQQIKALREENERIAQEKLNVQETKELEEAKAVIARAEKEGIANLMTKAELEAEQKVSRKNYNDLYNEGGEGYIPPFSRVSRERYEWALLVFKRSGKIPS